MFILVFPGTNSEAHPFDGDGRDVDVARYGSVPRITVAVRIVKIDAIGIGFGGTLDPAVIVDEVAEIAHKTRRIVAIVIDYCSLRRPSDVLALLAVEIGRLGIHYVSRIAE